MGNNNSLTAPSITLSVELLREKNPEGFRKQHIHACFDTLKRYTMCGGRKPARKSKPAVIPLNLT